MSSSPYNLDLSLEGTHQDTLSNYEEGQNYDEDKIFTLAFVNAFSPRSKEACLRQGIELTDLVYKSYESYEKTGLLPILQKSRFDHNNRRRRDLLDLVRQEHEKLVASNWKPSASKAKSMGFIVAQAASKSPIPKSPTKQAEKTFEKVDEESHDSSQLKMEQARLEKMLQRQQKELEQMVSYEIKIAELNAKQEEKLALRKQYEKELGDQERLHRQQIEEKKRQFELKKREEQLEEEQKNKQLSWEFQQKQQKFQAEEAEREKQRKLDIRRKAEERAEKQRAIEERAQEVLEEQFAIMSEKVKKMELRDQIRNDKLLQMKAELSAAQQKKSTEARSRVMKALDSNEKLLQEKREELHKKMQLQRERMDNFQQQMTERNKELAAAQALKDKQRREAKEAAEMEEKRKIDSTNNKLNSGEERKKQMDEEKAKELAIKAELDRINKEEKLANVRRIQRMEEYHRAEMINKMNREAERAMMLEQRKAHIINERKHNQLLAQMDKEKVLNAFQKMKNSSAKISASPISSILGKSTDKPLGKSSSNAILTPLNHSSQSNRPTSSRLSSH